VVFAAWRYRPPALADILRDYLIDDATKGRRAAVAEFVRILRNEAFVALADLCVGGIPGSCVSRAEPGGQPLKRILADRPVLCQQCGVEPRIPIHVVPKPAIACCDCTTPSVTADSRQLSASSHKHIAVCGYTEEPLNFRSRGARVRTSHENGAASSKSCATVFAACSCIALALRYSGTM
jgi:hypothetical protein